MKKQAGVSLLELMLAIAIIMTMVIAATRFYQVTKQSAQTQNALTMIHEVVDASYKWYESHPSFSSINFTELVTSGLLPINYSEGKRFNPWGGKIILGPVSGNPDKLLLKLDHVPIEQCNKMQQQLQQYNATCQPDTGNLNMALQAEF